VTAAWCLSGDGTPEPGAVEVRARPLGDTEGWALDGVARYVQAAQNASVLLVVATGPDGSVCQVLVPRPERRSVRADTDRSRRDASLRRGPLRGVTVPAANLLAGGQDTVDHCISLATVLQSAESVGAAELMFEATVDYLKKRVQFGRTIGSFQAIKHRLADLVLQVEAMRVAAHYAALAFGDGLDDAAEAVATAGSYVDDTFACICGEALQLHGGIGFTWEHDVHLFTRRAKVNQVLYGDGAWHRERLVRLIEHTGGGLTTWT